MEEFILIILISVCHAAPPLILAPVRNADDFGASIQFKNQDSIGNYNFGYNEGHLSGGSFRREAGDAAGNVAGSYGLRDADGRLRIVSYIADANGFRAKVDSNEPGLEPQDPASAIFNKPAVLKAQPVLPPSPLVLPAPAPVEVVPVPPPRPFPVAVPILPPPPPLPLAVPFLQPPPPPPGLAVPAFPKAIGPYVNPPLPVKRPPVLEYYGTPYINRVIPTPVIRPNLPILPPVRVNNLPYEFPSKKSLPSFQPLGFS